MHGSSGQRRTTPAGFHVRQEQPLTLADSEPEPDVAVVIGDRDTYRTVHPTTASLVIEVAISSVELDREKASLYAQAGVSEYLIVMPGTKTCELYRDPNHAGYGKVEVFKIGSVLQLQS